MAKSWSQAEYEYLLSRVSSIETMLNTIQNALNNLSTKSQLKSLNALLQAEDTSLRDDLEQLEITGSGPALEAHKAADDHDNYLTNYRGDLRYYTENEVDTVASGINHGDLENSATGDDHTQYLLTDGSRPVIGNFEVSGLMSRNGYPVLDGVSDYSIYVDPTGGDDTGTGAIGDPIQTLQEAANRVSLVGTDVTVELLAGDHVLPNYSGTEARLIFQSLGSVFIRCANTTDDSFTFASASDNVWTAQGTPGWTIDEHSGAQIEWGSMMVFIISNTADTLTLAYLPNSITGGYKAPPTAGDSFDIKSFSARIIPSATSAGNFANRLYVSGDVKFECWFDGESRAGQGPTGYLSGSNIVMNGSKFTNWNGTAFAADKAPCVSTYSWFENCARGISTDNFLTFTDGNVFTNCSECVRLWSRARSATAGSVFAFNCTTIVRCRDSGHFDDFFSAVWLDTVTNYIQLNSNCSYVRENTPVKIWPGKEQPNIVVDIAGNNANVSFEVSSVAATMIGTTAYIDMNGELITHADYITDLSITDDNFNQVSG